MKSRGTEERGVRQVEVEEEESVHDGGTGDGLRFIRPSLGSGDLHSGAPGGLGG